MPAPEQLPDVDQTATITLDVAADGTVTTTFSRPGLGTEVYRTPGPHAFGQFLAVPFLMLATHETTEVVATVPGDPQAA